MAAKIIFRKKEYNVRHGTTILTALKRLRIQPEAVLPTKNGELVLEDDIIAEDDVIKLVGVISGG
jgi:sulfur carrier protein ThiS